VALSIISLLKIFRFISFSFFSPFSFNSNYTLLSIIFFWVHFIQFQYEIVLIMDQIYLFYSFINIWC
jgi:hypothetical protein